MVHHLGIVRGEVGVEGVHLQGEVGEEEDHLLEEAVVEVELSLLDQEEEVAEVVVLPQL